MFSGIQTAGMVTSGCMNADVCNLKYMMRFEMRSQHRVSWVKVGACRTKKNAGDRYMNSLFLVISKKASEQNKMKKLAFLKM